MLIWLGAHLGAIASLCAVIGSLWTAGKFLWRHFRKRADVKRAAVHKKDGEWEDLLRDVAAIGERVQHIEAETRTNGGSSMKDAVNFLRADLALDRAARRAAWDTAAYEMREEQGVTRVTFVTPQYTALTGLGAVDCERDGWVRAVSSDDRERVAEEHRQAMEHGTHFVSEYTAVNVVTGEEARVQQRETPVVLKDKVVGWVGELRTLAERA